MRLRNLVFVLLLAGCGNSGAMAARTSTPIQVGHTLVGAGDIAGRWGVPLACVKFRTF